MLYRGVKKKPSKSTQRLQYCLWFMLFLVIAGLSLFLISKFMDDQLKEKVFHIKTSTAESPSDTGAQTTRKAALYSSEEEEDKGKQPKRETESDKLPTSSSSSGSAANLQLSSPSFDQIHFIHIPKCGGTSMTAVLRQMACSLNPVKNADCCLNPGFCDWHAFRRCEMIKGCINHFPNRKLIFQQLPSMAVFREPTSRLISAFFYRGHSPNLDFFQVRPEFKDIKDNKRPRVFFQEYIEMPEYQNIFTRMLGADSFPYRNITITEDVFAKAVDALNHIYFVAVQEDFAISVEALGRMMRVPNASSISVTKERGGDSKSVKLQKHSLRNDRKLMDRVREVNHYDIRLYELVVKKYCAIVGQYPDLMAKLKAEGNVTC